MVSFLHLHLETIRWRWTTKHTIDASLLYNTTTFIARSLQDWLQTTVNWIWLFYQHYRIRGRTCPCQAGTRICLSSRHFSCDVSFLVLFCFLVIQHFSTQTITFQGTAWLLVLRCHCQWECLRAQHGSLPSRLLFSRYISQPCCLFISHTHTYSTLSFSLTPLSHTRALRVHCLYDALCSHEQK